LKWQLDDASRLSSQWDQRCPSGRSCLEEAHNLCVYQLFYPEQATLNSSALEGDSWGTLIPAFDMFAHLRPEYSFPLLHNPKSGIFMLL
jgi:hypothetical protein